MKEGVEMPPLLPKSGNPKVCDCGCQLEQRSDDTEAVVRDRLTVYKNETQPLIGFYQKIGILRNFEVKRGLDDLPKLEEMLRKELK
jgi:adenylate kinase family enzyme